MLEIVVGQRHNVISEKQLVQALRDLDLAGTLYIGYPIIAAADEPIVIEALLTCLEHGVVVFDLGASSSTNVPSLRERQDDLFAALGQKLMAYKPLRSGRQLSVDLNVVTLVPAPVKASDDVLVATPAELPELLRTFDAIAEDRLTLVNAAIQRITTIKPANKRANVTKTNSRGAIMQQIEREIANLDRWQKQAAIESPDSPQRIRGLAGSGKTVVLALKAAYLHARNRDWTIAITFHTRALYQQFKDLVRRFCFEHLNDEPDWSRLRILHAWGASRQVGIYSEIASQNGLSALDFTTARNLYGYETAFEGACDSLLDQLKKKAGAVQLFDAVLIDEAQDLPRSFFELVFQSTREPKRIVWAYDELQNLGAYTMVPPSELFGVGDDGKPRVENLDWEEGSAQRDIILPVCYRNTPWALTTAHALGFGIYRKRGLVQFFDNPRLWEEVGYRVNDGELSPGKNVSLARRDDSYPGYFKELLQPADSVACFTFDDPDKQATWVAEQIEKNLTEDELQYRDILVIVCDPLTSRTEAARVIDALESRGLSSHLAGVTTSVDQLFQDDSIAISGIYRAKGNEAPMVYILNSECGVGPRLSVRNRNILFTAITRSRAWVRICGSGPYMDVVKREVGSVQANDYRLVFKVPTDEELTQIRKIHRDLTKSEMAKYEQAEKKLAEVLAMIRKGEISPEMLPPELLRDLQVLTPNDDDAE